MSTPENRPYITAASAARELGYTQSTYITSRCRLGQIQGAYQDGGIWLVPVAWVQVKKERDAAHGIVRGVKPGGHVTTGAGLKRKRPDYKPTGKPRGWPKKSVAETSNDRAQETETRSGISMIVGTGDEILTCPHCGYAAPYSGDVDLEYLRCPACRRAVAK